MIRLTGILKGEYRVKVANNGERCPQIALVSPPIVLARSTRLAVINRDRFSA